jgi:hypothetical protein
MLPTEAMALAFALEGGAATLAEARAWADAQISRPGTPSAELIDLATAHDVSTAVALLHLLGQGADNTGVGRAVYAWLLKGLTNRNISPSRAADVVVRLSRESMAPSAAAEDDSWHFDDAFYLAAHEQYGTVEGVTAELEEHLRLYAA